MSIDFTTFPFKFLLNLRSYIEHVLKVGEDSPGLVPSEVISGIKMHIRDHPELMEIFEEDKDLAPYQEFFNILFSTLLPLRGGSSSLQGITLPFTAVPYLVATEPYEKLVDPVQHDFSVTEISISGEVIDARVLYGYKSILKKFYNLELKVDHPIICEVFTSNTGLCRYFKLIGQGLFMDVIALGPLPKFDANDLQQLLERKFDPDEWANKLPPELFLFTGFTLTTLMDVTTEEAITRLQRNLARRDFDDPEWFQHIRTEIQNLFRLQGLRLGIATVQRDGSLNHTSQNPLWNSLLIKELAGNETSPNCLALYEEVIRNGQTVIIEELQNSSRAEHPLVKGIIALGYNNLVLIPLYYLDRLIGILELASPIRGEINGLSLFKINQVKPIFAIALTQLQEEFENKAEAIMMQQYTSIHPAIRWRFRQAAIRLMEEDNITIEQENIVFEDVYPFYGALDVRDSSRKRSQAIAKDLLLHLHSAREVLQKGYDLLAIDILEALIIDIEKRSDKVRSSFVSGDETEITLFILEKVNPIIQHLEQHYPAMGASVEEYRTMIKADRGICTRHRKGYEESITMINQVIAKSLEEEEKEMQRLYPCYFEKYRTDGVEYNIYIGSSIAKGRPLDLLYLDNLRLRQLLWTCRMIREVAQLQPRLQELTVLDGQVMNNHDHDVEEQRMTIAPLILAYVTPITLNFRHDEKRLEVDGAYNVRYEVLKKRIDKAVVVGSHERVTQPGCIAIMYTRDEEGLLYEKHLEYLVKKNMILPGWEKLVLDPLPGVDGLRALRVKVNLP